MIDKETGLTTIPAAASEPMQRHCRVGPGCNGVTCAGEVPGMGGRTEGAVALIDRLKNELPSAMVLTGGQDAAAVGPEIRQLPTV